MSNSLEHPTLQNGESGFTYIYCVAVASISILVSICMCFTLGMAEKYIEFAKMLRQMTEWIWLHCVGCNWLSE